MAKIRKYKLSWQASNSETVSGYKLYWSEGMEIGYDSQFIDVGNVTEMELPDDVALANGPVMLGVTAVDDDGNESDITTLAEPYQLVVPNAPAVLSMTHSQDFKVLEPKDALAEKKSDEEDPLADAIESHEHQKVARMKYYDDVGYRGLNR